jgi:hypothetical protein
MTATQDRDGTAQRAPANTSIPRSCSSDAISAEALSPKASNGAASAVISVRSTSRSWSEANAAIINASSYRGRGHAIRSGAINATRDTLPAATSAVNRRRSTEAVSSTVSASRNRAPARAPTPRTSASNVSGPALVCTA